MSITSQFQSTLPVWGGTQLFRHGMQVHRHFNPPSPCGEGLETGLSTQELVDFNPPSPCGEGQPGTSAHYFVDEFQSTLPVWGGTLYHMRRIRGSGFQSTLPVWGGTRPRYPGTSLIYDFNPPSPCGEGHQHSRNEFLACMISIHPPRVGRDRASTAYSYLIL